MKITKKSTQYSHGLVHEVECKFTHNTKDYRFYSWDYSEEAALRDCLNAVENLIAELRVLQDKLEGDILSVLEKS